MAIGHTITHGFGIGGAGGLTGTVGLVTRFGYSPTTQQDAQETRRLRFHTAHTRLDAHSSHTRLPFHTAHTHAEQD